MGIIREKKTKSGKLLEVDFYPIFPDGRKIPQRAPKTQPTSKEQERYNAKRAIRKFVRIVNANFETGDLFVHITYDQEKAPQDGDIAKKDVANYIRRIKSKRNTELKRVLKLLEKIRRTKSFWRKNGS